VENAYRYNGGSMSQQAALALKDKLKRNRYAKTHKSTISSAQALPMIKHSSELNFTLTVPIGTQYNGRTHFVGCHSDNVILIETPSMTVEDKEYYLQEGFWMELTAISPRGKGALLTFRSQIINIMNAPVAIIVLSMPTKMQMSQLRQEPRYEVTLFAKALLNEQKFECEIHDLSKTGCQIITSLLTKNLHIGDVLKITITKQGKMMDMLPTLTAIVCNTEKSRQHNIYGLKFDNFGQKQASNLLAKLKFDGNKLGMMDN